MSTWLFWNVMVGISRSKVFLIGFLGLASATRHCFDQEWVCAKVPCTGFNENFGWASWGSRMRPWFLVEMRGEPWGLRSAQPELHQRHQCNARERRLGVVIWSDWKQWERVSHENTEHLLCGSRTRCPCWVVKDVASKNWEDLCDENGHESGLTKKSWQLLPSVVRVHRRHSGYLFFDERGRIYRLRDEEIILWKDVALLSNVGWPCSVCLWLELPWPNVWWFFFMCCLLLAHGVTWEEYMLVAGGACEQHVCQQIGSLGKLFVWVGASPRKEAATATMKEVAARKGQFFHHFQELKSQGSRFQVGWDMSCACEKSIPGRGKIKFSLRGSAVGDPSGILCTKAWVAPSFSADPSQRIVTFKFPGESGAGRSCLLSIFDALRVLPESFGALAGERFRPNHCDGCHHRNVWLVPSLSPQRRGR